MLAVDVFHHNLKELFHACTLISDVVSAVLLHVHALSYLNYLYKHLYVSKLFRKFANVLIKYGAKIRTLYVLSKKITRIFYVS